MESEPYSIAAHDTGVWGSESQIGEESALKIAETMPPPGTDPKKIIVIIYASGSQAEYVPDLCDMRETDVRYGLPRMIRDLQGQQLGDMTFLVDGFCTPTKIGQFDQYTLQGKPKLHSRSQEIAARARAWQRRGVPEEQIFLVGFSAGGWASLKALALAPDVANAAIAFTPAFSGPLHERNLGWSEFRRVEVEKLAAARRLNALVFAFPLDRFEPPKDLAFLKNVPEVRFVEADRDKLYAQGCTPYTLGHYLLFERCFQKLYWPVVRDYIRAQLGFPPASDGPKALAPTS